MSGHPSGDEWWMDLEPYPGPSQSPTFREAMKELGGAIKELDGALGPTVQGMFKMRKVFSELKKPNLPTFPGVVVGSVKVPGPDPERWSGLGIGGLGSIYGSSGGKTDASKQRQDET